MVFTSWSRCGIEGLLKPAFRANVVTAPYLIGKKSAEFKNSPKTSRLPFVAVVPGSAFDDAWKDGARLVYISLLKVLTVSQMSQNS